MPRASLVPAARAAGQHLPSTKAEFRPLRPSLAAYECGRNYTRGYRARPCEHGSPDLQTHACRSAMATPGAAGDPFATTLPAKKRTSKSRNSFVLVCSGMSTSRLQIRTLPGCQQPPGSAADAGFFRVAFPIADGRMLYVAMRGSDRQSIVSADATDPVDRRGSVTGASLFNRLCVIPRT